MAICPHIPAETQQVIANVILRLITPTNNKDAELFHNGELGRTLRTLSLQKHASWRLAPTSGDPAPPNTPTEDDGLSPHDDPPDDAPPRQPSFVSKIKTSRTTAPTKPMPSPTQSTPKPAKRKLNRNSLGRSAPRNGPNHLVPNQVQTTMQNYPLPHQQTGHAKV